jgi:hypothetical protein
MPPMNRREAVRATTLVVGGLLLTSSGLELGCAREAEQRTTGRVLTTEDQALMEAIADTLLPTTRSSPGAREAGAGAEINLLLTDCYEPEQQVRVVRGLAQLRNVCHARWHSPFSELPVATREQLLRDIDGEASHAPDVHWFTLAHELAARTYFSSEIGMTKARRWMLEPGKWVGCVPLTPGQPAWG